MKKIIKKLFLFSLLIYFLQSLNAWFTWHIPISLIITLNALVSIIFYFQNKKTIKFSFPIQISILAYVIAISYIASFWSFGQFVVYLVSTIPISIVIASDSDFKIKLLNFLTKWMALILLPSLILFILLLFGINLPDAGEITHPTSSFYYYTNYVFVLKGVYGIRFNSIFCEPGHLGMILSFMLFANNFNLKNKYVLILFISVFFTLSLAGIILTFVGFIIRNVFKQQFKKGLIYLISLGLIIYTIVIFSSQYNNGDNYVNKLIIERLEYDNQSGTIAGDNRVDFFTERAFNSILFFEFMFGKAFSQEYAGSGFKIYILKFGFISAFLFALFYYSLTKTSNNKLMALGLFFLYCLAFVQRSYPFWASQLLIFICAMQNFRLYDKYHIKKKK
ncbi:MAG: hypothetical protein ACOCVF_02445 [bacterium]